MALHYLTLLMRYLWFAKQSIVLSMQPDRFLLHLHLLTLHCLTLAMSLDPLVIVTLAVALS
jgi:hypothetical protein